jgi:hypothetical protein
MPTPPPPSLSRRSVLLGALSAGAGFAVFASAESAAAVPPVTTTADVHRSEAQTSAGAPGYAHLRGVL